jgi:hypothetical protein
MSAVCVVHICRRLATQAEQAAFLELLAKQSSLTIRGFEA